MFSSPFTSATGVAAAPVSGTSVGKPSLSTRASGRLTSTVRVQVVDLRGEDQILATGEASSDASGEPKKGNLSMVASRLKYRKKSLTLAKWLPDPWPYLNVTTTARQSRVKRKALTSIVALRAA